MTVPAQIQDALSAMGMTDAAKTCRALAGGCIHDVQRIEFENHKPLVAKSSAGQVGLVQLRTEAVGLNALSAKAGDDLQIPEVIGLYESDHGNVLLMEWLAPGAASHEGWKTLGRALAQMHESNIGAQYGFEHDNFIGGTPQINTWQDDWVEFNRSCRFGPQIRMARDAGHLSGDQTSSLDGLLDRLGEYLPVRPEPALLHGDLWSGNIMSLEDGGMAIIDPACSIGDGWADIAMMQLFGGVPDTCIKAYADARTGDSAIPPERLAVYQLYHVLNHLNLFGQSYLAQVMRLFEAVTKP
ncbi:MAG: fructosamine kinase family protein [Phycisphaerales bacterium]|nr:fructosamine kinase family protein [Phycisphaerales bacterium]